jgi:hydrogenase-1 operon protein HyaF
MNPTPSSFPIPIMPIGPGSQAEDETLDYMVMPSGMATYRPPVLPEREAIASLSGAHAALRATLAALVRVNQGLRADPVDLAGLNEAERQLINQVLGEGEVAVRVDVPQGELLIQESVFAGVWRVLGKAAAAGDQAEAPIQSDHIEVGRMPLGVTEAAQRLLPAGARRQVSLRPADQHAWPEGVMNAPAILSELEEAIQAWRPGRMAHVINMTLLPLSPADIAVIDQALGRGPVQMLSRGYGNCRITHTEVPLCWRVSYFNSQDALILDTVEVTDLPEVACAAPEDLVDSHERLADMLQWVEGA